MTGIVLNSRDVTERRQAEEARRESEERYRTLVERSPDMIGVLVGGRLTYVNPAGLKLFGADRPEQMLGKSVADFLHPDDLPVVRERIRQATETALSNPLVEMRILQLDGTMVYIDGVSIPLVYQGQPAVQFICRDITERKQAEGALENSERKYRNLVDNALTGVYQTDLKGEIVFSNPALADILGFRDAAELIGTNVLAVYKDPQDRQRLVQILQKVESTSNFEIELLTRDGQTLTVLLSASLEGDTISGMMRDITERKQAEEALAQSNEKLRALTKYWQSSIEAERAHTARELHDEFGQSMTALKMDLEWLADRLPESDEYRLHLDGMNTLVDDSIHLMREIASSLRPTMLDDLGLSAALEWQAQEFTKRSGIPCQLSLPPDDLCLDPALNTTLFRVFKETLTNVIRHAQATRVDASLRQEARSMALTVQDNGCGITESDIKDPQSLGLLGMQERVAQWGGSLTLQGWPGKGTTVTVQIPLHAATENGGHQ